MEPNNKIDKLFSEGFANLEIDPGKDGWAALDKRMTGNARKRRLILIRWTGIAAVLLLIFSGGYFWHNGHNQETLRSPIQEAGQDILEGGENHGSSQKADQATAPDYDANADNIATEIDNEPLLPAADNKRQGDQTMASTRNQSGAVYKGIFTSTEAGNRSADDSPKSEIVQSKQYPPAPLLPDTMLYPTMAAGIYHFWSSGDNTVRTETPTIDLSRFTLGVYISPSFGFSSVEIKDPEDVAAINAGNDRVMPTVTAGLELEYRTNGRWSFAAGLFASQWTQHNDRLVATVNNGSPTTSSTSVFSNNSTANLRFDDDGDKYRESFANSGDGLLLVPELSETYRFLEVPLSVSYYLFERGPWSCKLRAGINSRFLTSSNVELQYQDGRLDDVDNLTLKGISFQLLTGAGIEYRLNSRLRASLMPAGLYGLTPVNQHDVVDTYFNQFMIYTGISFQL